MTNAQGITVVILAGGHGSRMGSPKASLLLNGRSLLHHVLDAVAPIADQVIVVRSALYPLPPIDQTNVKVLVDEAPGEGPLRALATAFSHTRSKHVVAVGCDMPFLNPILMSRLASLIDGYDAAVPIVEGRQQPLHAAYRTAAASIAADDALRRGERRVSALLTQLHVREVERREWIATDPTARSFFNINNPEDLALAASLR
ncbi:MAG: molybdenum cofactor guanylyltransferase [Chloroflexi bacterium]|nr:molybdenum cofactor guanylyltransferase [Chloroflexota bacterium]